VPLVLGFALREGVVVLNVVVLSVAAPFANLKNLKCNFATWHFRQSSLKLVFDPFLQFLSNIFFEQNLSDWGVRVQSFQLYIIVLSLINGKLGISNISWSLY
jgi:hypothetical protein